MPTNAEKAIEIWKSLQGKPEGTGQWLQVDQSRINTFADATLDHQFIHLALDVGCQLVLPRALSLSGQATGQLVG